MLAGLSLVAFGSIYFFNVSAKTEDVEKLVEDNLVLGRLAFSVTAFGPGPDGWIVASNPDGSGASAMGIQGFHIPVEPAWSPDGTRILFVGTQTTDIFALTLAGSVQTNLTNTPNPTAERNPSWSVSGKIAYERASQIWTMNADGSGQAQFTAITQPSPAAPAWSPDGTKLAFVSSTGIWVINADGTNERLVTTSGGDPAWSPDGTKIVFARSGIFVINADGTNETPINPGITDREPAWSPDGTKIAVRGSNGIYTMDPDGGNRVRIYADVINFPLCCDNIPNDPAWQPVAQTPNTFIISGRVTYNNVGMSSVTVNLNGTTNAATTTDAVGNYQFSALPPGGNYNVSPSFLRHYFTPPNRTFNNLSSNQVGNFEVLGSCSAGRCARNGKISFDRSGDIFTINSDGTNQTNITNNAAFDGASNWSPDSAYIVFSTNRDGNFEIYKMNSDGGNPVRLTNNTAVDDVPYYSPDGASIVFASNRDGNYEIYKMNADGSNQVRLTNNTVNDYDPAFSPDGQKIVFVSFDSLTNLFTMNVDGSNRQPIPGNSGIVPAYENPSYSPDGSRIIYNYTHDASTQYRVAWRMNSDGTNRAQFPLDGRDGAYSPDGTRVVFTCCQFNSTNRLRTANADGGSPLILTPTATAFLPDWGGFSVPRAAFDFDGDGRADISFFRPTGGFWYQARSTGATVAPQWGLSTDVLAPADYDGDLKTDLAVWREWDGNFYVLNSFDLTVRIENFGLPGDVPTGGDFDGDGKADVAVYRGGAQGVLYYRASMGNPNKNITPISWGTTGDKPVVGDYDGDGRTDAAIFRPSSGTWYIRQSSNGQFLGGQFGLADDVLIPADYDGDGKTDIAVFRDGTWYLLRSAQGFAAFQFGIANDIPAPADYDGDGRADATIYRDGVWWILKSQSGGVDAIPFGTATDKPIPSAFVR
jgi:Tol biopolymer transport system component